MNQYRPEKQANVGHCCQPDDTWTLTLNRYQRDNLLFLLNVCGYPFGNPHIVPSMNFNTGDWIGEIANALAKNNRSFDGSVFKAVIDDDDLTNGLPHQLWPAGHPQ